MESKMLKKLVLKIYSKWEESTYKAFLKLLEHNPHAKAVDLGCGTGEFTLKVKEAIGAKEIIGVDIYEPAIVEARRKGIKVVKHDLNSFPYPFRDNEFDVVVSNQVIEHLFYPVRFMKEIKRILKPGGYAVIGTENLASWDNIIALILGYTPFSMEFDSGLRKIGNPLSPHDKEQVDPTYPPHVRILTYKGLIDLAKYIGFKVEKAVSIGHVLGKVGETLDKRHSRFMILKLRNPV